MHMCVRGERSCICVLEVSGHVYVCYGYVFHFIIIEISINSGKKTDIVLDTDREIAPNN